MKELKRWLQVLFCTQIAVITLAVGGIATGLADGSWFTAGVNTPWLPLSRSQRSLRVSGTGRSDAFTRTKHAKVTAQPSPQQVMRNTRAELPDEYREWFDWTAELAGFEEPKRPAVVGRPQYGPGAGWTHTDQHTWVEMQT